MLLITTKNIALKRIVTTAIAIIFVFITGCTSLSTTNNVDPWETWNRGISQFNDDLDRAVVKPAATVYVAAVPRPVRTGVNNFFFNLTGAWTVINSALQLKPKATVESLFRFSINTVFGFGGIFDIASEMNIERHSADFGQTLGHYGVPAGPYMVLPFLGSSTLRDTLATTLISKGDLVWQLDSVPARNSLYALRLLDVRANLLRSSSVLEAVALDKYTFTRDVYLQVRTNSIMESMDPPYDDSETPEFRENMPAGKPAQPSQPLQPVKPVEPVESVEPPKNEIEKKSSAEPQSASELVTAAAVTSESLVVKPSNETSAVSAQTLSPKTNYQTL